MIICSSSLFRPRSPKSRPREVVCPEDSNLGIAAMPGIHFAQVRATISLAEILNLIGFVPCEASGDQVRGPCPVHRSTSPSSRSFSAHLNRHIYRCFQCGSAENQLDLYASVTGLNLTRRPSLFASSCTRRSPGRTKPDRVCATRSDRPVKSSRDQAGICTLDSL